MQALADLLAIAVAAGHTLALADHPTRKKSQTKPTADHSLGPPQQPAKSLSNVLALLLTILPETELCI